MEHIRSLAGQPQRAGGRTGRLGRRVRWLAVQRIEHIRSFGGQPHARGGLARFARRCVRLARGGVRLRLVCEARLFDCALALQRILHIKSFGEQRHLVDGLAERFDVAGRRLAAERLAGRRFTDGRLVSDRLAGDRFAVEGLACAGLVGTADATAVPTTPAMAKANRGAKIRCCCTPSVRATRAPSPLAVAHAAEMEFDASKSPRIAADPMRRRDNRCGGIMLIGTSHTAKQQ